MRNGANLSAFGEEVDLEFDIAQEDVLFLRQPRLNLDDFVQSNIQNCSLDAVQSELALLNLVGRPEKNQ
jgi:hypothetical protein